MKFAHNDDRCRSFVLSFYALVTSRLDFCNAFDIGLSLCLVRKLQLVQNMAARLVTNPSRGEHITPTLISLHWLPISFPAKYKVLVITFKALHGLGPGYLRDRLLPYSPPHTLRSSGENLLQSAKTRLTTVTQRTFSSVAPDCGMACQRFVKLTLYLNLRRL